MTPLSLLGRHTQSTSCHQQNTSPERLKNLILGLTDWIQQLVQSMRFAVQRHILTNPFYTSLYILVSASDLLKPTCDSACLLVLEHPHWSLLRINN